MAIPPKEGVATLWVLIAEEGASSQPKRRAAQRTAAARAQERAAAKPRAQK
jgi:hypothetical protein